MKRSAATPLRETLSGLLLACLFTSGCQSIVPNRALSWPWQRTDQDPVVPDRILAVWSDTVLHQPGEPGLRGFGGRLFFYQGEKKDPVEVDGGLAVYVFDADKVEPHSPAPERKFVFNADQFSGHMSQSELGRSYSVWLPWDEVGGPSRRLSIVARFEGRHGGVVISQPTLKLLPGVPHIATVSSATVPDGQLPVDDSVPDSRIRSVGYDAPNAGDETSGLSSRKSATRMTTHTIDLPPSFYQRNLRATATEEPSSSARDLTTATSPITAIRSRQGATTPETTDQDPNGQGPNETAPEDVDGLPARTSRHYPARTAPALAPRNRTLRREPFRAGWIEGLPQTPRR